MGWEGSENRGKGEALEDKAENFGLRRDFMALWGLRVLVTKNKDLGIYAVWAGGKPRGNTHYAKILAALGITILD